MFRAQRDKNIVYANVMVLFPLLQSSLILLVSSEKWCRNVQWRLNFPRKRMVSQKHHHCLYASVFLWSKFCFMHSLFSLLSFIQFHPSNHFSNQLIASSELINSSPQVNSTRYIHSNLMETTRLVQTFRLLLRWGFYPEETEINLWA